MATQCAVVNYVYLSFRSFLLKPVYLIVYPGLYLGNRFLDDRRYLIRRACGHVDVGTCPHQVLAVTLTLSQPGRADYAYPILGSLAG